MKNKGRRNKSLCEKSMKMVTNVMRLSSLSISRMSLGIASQPSAPASGPSTFIKASTTAKFPDGLRYKEPMNTSKPIAYLIDPVESDNSIHVVHNEDSVDGRASDFIRKVHEKHQRDLNEALYYSAFIIPPPPCRM